MSDILTKMPVERFTKFLHSNFSYAPDSLASLGDKFRQLLIAGESNASAREKLHQIQLFWRSGYEKLPERLGTREPPDTGVLKASGYYVRGSTLALPLSERRAVLRYIMTEEDIPPIKDKAHMREWGAARSMERLAKLEAVLWYLADKASDNPLLETPRLKWAEDYAFVVKHEDAVLSPEARKKMEAILERCKADLLREELACN